MANRRGPFSNSQTTLNHVALHATDRPALGAGLAGEVTFCFCRDARRGLWPLP